MEEFIVIAMIVDYSVHVGPVVGKYARCARKLVNYAENIVVEDFVYLLTFSDIKCYMKIAGIMRSIKSKLRIV